MAVGGNRPPLSRENSLGGLAEVLSVFGGGDEREIAEELSFRERVELMAKEKEIWDSEKVDLEALVAHLQRANRTLMEERHSLAEENRELKEENAALRLAASRTTVDSARGRRSAGRCKDGGDNSEGGGRPARRRGSFGKLVSKLFGDSRDEDEGGRNAQRRASAPASTSRAAHHSGEIRRQPIRTPRRTDDDESVDDYKENYEEERTTSSGPRGRSPSRHSFRGDDDEKEDEHGEEEYDDECDDGLSLIMSFRRRPSDQISLANDDDDDASALTSRSGQWSIHSGGENGSGGLITSFRRRPPREDEGSLGDAPNAIQEWWSSEAPRHVAPPPPPGGHEDGNITSGKINMDGSFSGSHKKGWGWKSWSAQADKEMDDENKVIMDVSTARVPLPVNPPGGKMKSCWMGGQQA